MSNPAKSVVYRLAFLVAAAGLAAASANAADREPLDLIPQDSLLCWYGQPLPDTSPTPDRPSTLQTLLELGTRLAGSAGGGLDSTTQLVVRAGEMFNLMIRYPHALALIDARAKPVETDPAARRVDDLRCVLVVQNRGQSEPFLRLIQKAVNEQTDAGTARLETRQYAGWTCQELRDRRLPDWAVIAWGHIDGHFVLTIGRGVWPTIAAIARGEAPALSRQPWYATARQSRRHQALIEIFVEVEPIQQRLDPFVGGRASAFFQAWGLNGLKQSHWALGLVGRALFCEAHFRMRDQTVRRLYADPDRRDAELMATIPEGARYAIYRIPTANFLRRLSGAVLSIQGVKRQAVLRRIWNQIEAEHGFNVEQNLLAHLGQHVVLHNDPPHPLRIPLAVTALIELNGGADDVRSTIDTMCGVLQNALDQAAAEGRGPPPWNLRRDDDGVWYVQFGPIAGPAWTVTPRFVVLSWSPRALREYLGGMGKKRDGETKRRRDEE